MEQVRLGGAIQRRSASACCRLLALSILILLLAACTVQPMYEGERAPRDEVATITRAVIMSRGFFSDQHAKVRNVDGRKRGITFLLEIRSGRHTVSLEILEASSWFDSMARVASHTVAKPSITFDALAGRRYCIPALKIEDELWIWVLNDLGETVAGTEPTTFDVSCACDSHRYEGFCAYDVR